jgi:alcohol dehydrogenase class IV
MEIFPDFHIPTQIYLREDILNDIGNIVRTYGSRAVFITTTTDMEMFEDVIRKISSSLIKAGVGWIVYDEIPESPNTEQIDSAVFFIKKTKCDTIIAFGGLDAINAAKATAVLANNYIFCEELFESTRVEKPVNLITIPAYPVFGFEVIPMLFLTGIHDRHRRFYKNQHLYPLATIIDPKISLVIDEEKTVGGAVSALAIATESVISKKNNGLVNTLALRSIDLTFKNLPVIFREPANLASRTQLSLASVMAGIAFSMSELSVTLAISTAICSTSSITLENAMGVILPHIMEYNLTSSPGKYVQMSKVMDEDVKDITVIEAAIKAVEGVRKLEMEVDMPHRLSQFEIPKTGLSKIADIAINYPFLENAPRLLSKNEIETILIAAY